MDPIHTFLLAQAQFILSGAVDAKGLRVEGTPIPESVVSILSKSLPQQVEARMRGEIGRVRGVEETVHQPCVDSSVDGSAGYTIGYGSPAGFVERGALDWDKTFRPVGLLLKTER